jgi:hypothetical protein
MLDNVKAPSRSLCDELAVDLKNPASYYPIEKICGILYKEYSYDEMCELEAEFILQHIFKYHPEIDPKGADTKFIEKLYAIPAILSKPMLVTESLLAFYNTVMVCNDVPSGVTEEEDITDVPARFIHRTFLAVDAMLPEDMDFNDMYLYPNIKRWIFEMHKKDDEIILPPVLDNLQEEYLGSTYSVPQADKFNSIISELRPKLGELSDLLAEAITGKKDYTPEDDARLLGYNDGDLSELQIKLHKVGYYEKERAVLKKYSSGSFEDRCSKLYLTNVNYSYAYFYLNTGMNNRKMLLAVDLDSYPKDKLNLLLIEKIRGIFDYLTLMDTTEIHLFSEKYKMKDIAGFRLFLESIKDVEIILHEVKYREDRLVRISETMYDLFGPPSRLVILSNNYPSGAENEFSKHASNKKMSGWNVSIIR